MTASESTTRVVSDSGNDVGPGQRLREARQAAQLTLNEVASRMRLEPHVLESLENDHYERLHGPTFVRGYLSGYARLLDLPERPILEAYERHDHRPPALVSELGRKPEVHVSDFPVRMVTYVIAGLLVVLVVLWWQSRQPQPAIAEPAGGTSPSVVQSSAAPAFPSEPAPAPLPPAGTVPPTASAPAPAPPSLVSAVEPREPGAEPGADQATAPSPMEASPAISAAAMPPAPADTSADASPVSDVQAPDDEIVASAPPSTAFAAPPPAGSDTSSDGGAAASTGDAQKIAATTGSAPATDDAGNAATDAAAGGDEAQAEQAPRPAPLPGSDRLAIQFARESWVEIYDRGGGRLYYSLASEGSEVVVEGAGPMRVLLGDVEGAAVAYNGEPLDLSRYQGRSVVRFTVGELSSTTATEPPAPAPAEEPLTRAIPAPTPSAQARSMADASATPAPASPPVDPLRERNPAAVADAPQASAPVDARPDS